MQAKPIISPQLYSNYEGADTYDIWLKRLVPATSVRILNGSSFESYPYYRVRLYVALNPTNAIKEELTWTVDDQSIAHIEQYYDDGGIELYLNSVGTTTVTVTTESELSDSIEITVKEDSKPEYIKICQGSKLTKYLGDHVSLETAFYPEMFNEQVYWTSSNPDIVDIYTQYYNSCDMVCNKIGTTTITATSTSGLSASCIITVIPKQEIELNKTTKVTVATSGEYVPFTFTPEESGYYTFYSISNYDTRGEISEIYVSDDCGENKNFRITGYLQADDTYYFYAGLYSNSVGEFDVRLERLDVDTSGGDIDFDGEVNALDLAWMRKLIFGIIPLDSASQDIYDINQDNSFDVRDLVRLKTLIAKNN